MYQRFCGTDVGPRDLSRLVLATILDAPPAVRVEGGSPVGAPTHAVGLCFELVQKTDDMLPRGTLDRLDAKLLEFEERQKNRRGRYSSI